LLRRAIELDPDYGDARINLALVLRSRQDQEAARAEYALAVEDPRTGANGWFQWGLFEMEQGRNQEAIEILERGQLQAPGSIEILNALGEAYYRSARREEAIGIWRRSLELNPEQDRLRQALQEIDPR
jgi:tetratricopeptide (TPR) repeat protein